MSEKLISADELEKAFDKYKPNGEDLAVEDMWIDLFTELVQSPAVDAVEVVRCKDCNSYNGHRYCTYLDETVLDDDFCSYGERREG